MIYVRDVIQTIVESIRSTGSVTSFVDNTGSYTITTASTGNLEVGFKVVLIYADTSLNRDVIITAKTDTTFTYSGTGITEPATWQMALYFEVGHRLELNKKYTNKAKSTNKLVQEYPLFWLYTDFQKNKGDGEYTAFETSLQAAIADFSVKNKYEADRITDKFKPVLYPYFELIETAFNAGVNKRNFVTTFGEDNEIRFEPIDRPFFGSADEIKNVLPQVTDAIEFEVDLKWMIEKCGDGIVSPPFPPLPTDFDTWHKTITDKIFAESVENLPAKFLPRVAEFNGVSDQVVVSSSVMQSMFNEGGFLVKINLNDVEAQQIVSFRSNTSNRIVLELSSGGVLKASVKKDDVQVNASVNIAILADQTYYIYVFYDGADISLYVNAILQTLASVSTHSGGVDNVIVFSGRGGTPTAEAMNGKLFNFAYLDRELTTAEINDYLNNIIPSDALVHFEFTGQGDYEYDVSGNELHGVWSGAGNRFDYDLDGSTYPNDNGYSLWQHSTEDDIQVPYDINGLPLSLTPGVDIPTGYTKTRDIVSGGDKWNMADSLINFNPDELSINSIAIFDRSNTTRQTATSRASLFYDVLNPYIYQINEIADPRIYDTFFEAAYKDRVFGKVRLDGSDLIRYDEELNYDNQKTGNYLLSVEEYCNIKNIYP